MAIGLDIQTAIEKNLSAEVGEILKRRLEQAESDSKKVIDLRQLVEGLKNQVENLQNQVKSQEAIEQRIAVAQAAERAALGATTLKAIVELKEAHAKERVADMRSIVLAVFANNQFKYTTMENGSLPGGCDQYGNPRTTGYSRTSTGQGEGAPPPAPTGSP